MATTRTARLAVVTAVAAAFLASAVPAANAKGIEARAAGACTKAADWKLKAKTDDGRLQVEYEVDSNVVGQTWSVSITDNGVLVHSGTHKTVAPSGSFSVSRLVANRAGTDTFVARARNAATGETCSGRVVLHA